jgi:hypothetical protein
MLSGYAARDHRQMVIKQRRPDQGSHISPSVTASYRVDGVFDPLLFRLASTRVDARHGTVRYRGKIKCHLFSF